MEELFSFLQSVAFSENIQQNLVKTSIQIITVKSHNRNFKKLQKHLILCQFYTGVFFFLIDKFFFKKNE